MEVLERGKPLLDDLGSEESLAPLDAQIDRVVAEVLRQETAGEGLPRRRQREGPLEVAKELLIRILAHRQDSAKSEREVVGDVVQPGLPPRPLSLCEHAGPAVRQDAGLRPR